MGRTSRFTIIISCAKLKSMKKLVVFLFAGLVFLTTPQIVFADCEIADWDANSRDLTVCVGEFQSVEDLRSTTATFDCLGNSNSPNFSLCRDIRNPSYSLASTPDDQIAQDANGLYYTCITAQGINRAIGKLEVDFTGGTSCTTASIITKPADWDPLTEGMPWQEGTNDPGDQVNPLCNDEESINTAIGCIPISSTNDFLAFILRWAIGIGGGIAFLLILVSGFQIMTSSGNPERLQGGKELMTSAIAGLVMLIFSIFILRIIGIDILGLENIGFGVL